MKPALSVILFTVLSGAGYGLWCLLGVALAGGSYPLTGIGILVPLLFGFVLVSTGLLGSTLHLGRPERAWRALTQWRSSWLSREGIASLVTYVPMLALAWLALAGGDAMVLRAAAGVLAVCAAATVVCTARIYTSLKPIAAWHDARVLPLYLVFAGLSGGLWLRAYMIVQAPTDSRPNLWPLVLLVLCILAIVLKFGYWRALRRQPAVGPGHATGLDRLGQVRSFEGPTTEQSYLTREMAFVLARKHAGKLHAIAMTLFGAIPLLALALALSPLPGGWDHWIALIAALCCSGGLFVERWLFFAEARHAVAAYFPPQTMQ